MLRRTLGGKSWVDVHILNDSINEGRDGLRMLRGLSEVAQGRSLGSLSPFFLNHLVSAYPPHLRLKKCVSTTTLGVGVGVGWGHGLLCTMLV